MIERIVKLVLDLKPQGASGMKSQMEEIRALRSASLPGNIKEQGHMDQLKKQAEQGFQVAKVTDKFGAGAGNALKMVQGLENQFGAMIPVVGAVVGAHKAYMAVLDKLGPGGSILKMATGGLMGFIEGLQDFIHKWIPLFNELGKAASPAMAKEQERAWRDLYAVLGRLFLPVTRAVTDAVRLLADVFHTMIPDSQTMASVTNSVSIAMRALRVVISSLIPGGLKSSVGASGVGGQYSTGADFAKQQNIAALSATGAMKAPERTAIAAEKILNFIMAQSFAGQALKAARGITGMING